MSDLYSISGYQQNSELTQPRIICNFPSVEAVLFRMGLFGVLFFVPAYALLQKGLIDYKSLLLFEGLVFASPHLTSTYLKVFSDQRELARHKWVALFLPFLMLIFLTAFVYRFGSEFMWIIGSVYFYWQWWHHARQSFGLGRQFQREFSGSKQQDDSLNYFKLALPNEKGLEQPANFTGVLTKHDFWLNDLAIWTMAIVGLCLKSNIAGDHYEGIPIKVLHLPLELVGVILGLATIVLLVYFFRQLELFRTLGLIQVAFLMHWAIQSIVFICFFGLLPTDIGIIAASFWHCSQYITFVKAHQEKKNELNLIQNPFWKNMFDGSSLLIYLGLLFCFSFIFPALRLGLRAVDLNTIAFALGITITFHHYILDAVLWTKKEVAWSFKSAS